MTKPRIYVALSTFAKQSPEPLDLLKKSGLDFTLNTSGKRITKDQLLKEAHDADGIVAGVEPYDIEVILALPHLKCISRCGVGVDNVDLNFARQKGITVLNTPEAVTQPVAELTLALILDLLRCVTAHSELMRQKKWKKLVGWQLAGKKVGIIGLGRIGRKVAELLKKLDAIVYAHDIEPNRAWSETQGVVLLGLNELLAQSDIVTLHLTSLENHPFCLGTPEINGMKKGAFLVNVARGNLVDEQALVEALINGHLAGAALDVYTTEPYTGPLCDMQNVILTPHAATLTHESRSAMEIQAVLNLLNFFKLGK